MKREASLKYWLDEKGVIPKLCVSRNHHRFSVEKIDKKKYAYIRCADQAQARILERNLLAEGFDVNLGFWVNGTMVEVEVL